MSEGENIGPTKDEEDAAWVVRSNPALAARTLVRLNRELTAERERAARLERERDEWKERAEFYRTAAMAANRDVSELAGEPVPPEGGAA